MNNNDLTNRPYVSNVTWSDNYLESITVVKDWTAQNPPQQPKTSFYSWLDHKLRFSVENKNYWWLRKGNEGENYYNYDGLGLCNISNGYSKFYIHNLKVGDEFHIEYYRYNNSVSPFLTAEASSPFLEESAGSVSGSTAEYSYSGNSAIFGNNNDGPVFYRMTSEGYVCISIPSKTIIRSVTIKHAQYQKATYETVQITDGAGNIGYKTTMTGSGVLENKRGAVPYITMRFGAEKDMTFVRDLGSFAGAERFAASCIIDESNEFTPSIANLQYPYRDKTGDYMKNYLAGKEWSVFTATLNATANGDDFNSIYPLYGSYYYFFPEVDGKLNMQFFCEGSEETPAFWYKMDANGNYPAAQPAVTKINTNADGRTAGINYYEYEVDVKKGGIYYLCSLPTNIAHEHPILRLISYSFIPEFRLDPLWYVATDAEKTNRTIEHAAELNQDFTTDDSWTMTYECLGNISSAEPYFDNKVLKFRNIVYKSQSESNSTLNDGGVVIVKVSCADGKASFALTVPYSAEKAIMTEDANRHYNRIMDTDTERNPNGKVVKKWDFFSNILDIGQYSNTSSQLYNEVHKPDGLTADWVKTYMNLHNNTEPIFKSVYDMEGDNADMLVETEGLLFFTQSNQLGIYNENNTSTSDFCDRYIGLIGGGEVWVPSLKAGDRIVIKMGRYGESSTGLDAHIEITGAQDAVGNTINSDYVLGGSHKLDTGDQSIPYGEYHFISTGGHFKLKLKDGPLLKLYSIVIYRNSKSNNTTILSENTVLGDNREILYTDRDGGSTKQMNISLHYYGLGERLADLTSSTPVSSYRTGSFMSTAPSFTPDGSSLHFTYSPAHSLFGSFRARLGVKTKDASQSYVTDYADHSMAVGYRETKTYPYTWDFTDLMKYATLDVSGNETGVSTSPDLRVWKGYGLCVQPEDCENGTVFVSGGQLYAGTTMFEETKGIGIHHFNNDRRRNGVLTMTGDDSKENGGLQVNDSRAASDKPLFYGFIVPAVEANQAIYVRAKKVDGSKTSQAKYDIGSGEINFTYIGTAGADDIFAMQMASNAEATDVKLCFQGYEIKKIAVSKDAKQFNAKGWTTESRDHDIDPSLTAYMTGHNIKTYLVTNVVYANKTVELTEIGSNSTESYLMHKSTANDDEYACILQNDAEGQLNIVNSSFHLFVPDIHDEQGSTSGENYKKKNYYTTKPSKMKSMVNGGTVSATDETNWNYGLGYQYYDINPNTGVMVPGSPLHTGPVAFYRIESAGASSTPNKGYLPVLMSAGGGAARFSIVFADGDENQSVGIVANETESTGNGNYYNLNGQRLNGEPSRHGLYIVNGKKMYVK